MASVDVLPALISFMASVDVLPALISFMVSVDVLPALISFMASVDVLPALIGFMVSVDVKHHVYLAYTSLCQKLQRVQTQWIGFVTGLSALWENVGFLWPWVEDNLVTRGHVSTRTILSRSSDVSSFQL